MVYRPQAATDQRLLALEVTDAAGHQQFLSLQDVARQDGEIAHALQELIGVRENVAVPVGAIRHQLAALLGFDEQSAKLPMSVVRFHAGEAPSDAALLQRLSQRAPVTNQSLEESAAARLVLSALDQKGITVDFAEGVMADEQSPEAPRQNRASVLSGSKLGSSPKEDGGMHDIQVLRTSLGEVAFTTGQGLKDTLNRDAVGAVERLDGEVRVAVADGMGHSVGADLAARVTVEKMLSAQTFEAGADEAYLDIGKRPDEEVEDGAGACVSAVGIRRNKAGAYEIQFGQAGDTQSLVFHPEDKHLQMTGEDNVTSTVQRLRQKASQRPLSKNEAEILEEYERLVRDRGEAACNHIVTTYINTHGVHGFRTENFEEPARSGSWVLLSTDGLGDNAGYVPIVRELLRVEREEKKAGRPFGAKEAAQWLSNQAVALSKLPRAKQDNIGIAVVKLA